MVASQRPVIATLITAPTSSEGSKWESGATSQEHASPAGPSRPSRPSSLAIACAPTVNACEREFNHCLVNFSHCLVERVGTSSLELTGRGWKNDLINDF